MILQNKKDIPRGKFKTPYINAKYVFPGLIALALSLIYIYNKDSALTFITNEKQMNEASVLVTSLDEIKIKTVIASVTETDRMGFEAANSDLETYMSGLNQEKYSSLVSSLPLSEDLKFESGLSLFKHKSPMWIFIIITFFLGIWAFRSNLSLSPLLGLICCLYMMAELGVSNWIGFGIWLLVGLVIYFAYSRKHSNLHRMEETI